MQKRNKLCRGMTLLLCLCMVLPVFTALGTFSSAEDTGITPYAEENGFVITDSVADPKGMTVNFFDYWVMGNQNSSDWQKMNSMGDVLQGINENHLLLFAGYYGTNNGSGDTDNVDVIGLWNKWTGNTQYPTNGEEYKPHTGIVASTLGPDGYPQLDLDNTNNPIPTIWQSWQYGDWANLINNKLKQKESLKYLFDPDSPHPGKESYPNVTGLFQIDTNGYYYYNSDENFAELKPDNTIALYRMPWNWTGSARGESNPAKGQFFPFNHWDDLFYENGDQKTTNITVQANDFNAPLNHYFGMTLEAEFQQPKGGKIDFGDALSQEMTFTFSGDDDVWIFIDDVLVGDVGGIHLADGIEINFATGQISYRALDLNGGAVYDDSISIKDMFVNALGEDVVKQMKWNGNTFADNSIHTFKFYYMERGNDVSNCSISFNLEPVLKDRVRKVDEDGNPLKGAEFALYEAVKDGYQDDNTWHFANEFEVEYENVQNDNGEYVRQPKTLAKGIKFDNDVDNEGYYTLVNEQGKAIDFTDYVSGSEETQYFILRETKTPSGYRKNADIVLEYHATTETFTVVNKYETGAYASFVAYWLQRQRDVYYAHYDTDEGQFSEKKDEDKANDDLKDGLTILVPVIKQTSEDNFQRWLPMYGSNTNGWHTIADSYQDDEKFTNTQEQFELDLALAVILQIIDDDLQDWYLQWLIGYNRLEGYMENLPGDATRYLIYNPDGDLNLVPLFIPKEVLAEMGVNARLEEQNINVADATDEQRYSALRDVLLAKMMELREKAANSEDEAERNPTDEVLAKTCLNTLLENMIKDKAEGETAPDIFHILYTNNFRRFYRTVIYVPNERRALMVHKVDEEDESINGAIFAIFDTVANAQAFDKKYTSSAQALTALKNAADNSGLLSYGTTATVNSQEGMLVFWEFLRDEDGNILDGEGGDGYADITWPSERGEENSIGDTLWMVEIYCPDAYAKNENLVRIEVGDAAIYANATGFGKDGVILPEDKRENDGIKVYAALGKLSQTLVKYAMGNNVDVTLQDITLMLQKQTGGANGALEAARGNWENDEANVFNLHYGTNPTAWTGQYGLHDGDTAKFPTLGVFEATDGYIRAMPRQSSTIHDRNAKRDELVNGDAPIDLDGLFGLLNVVEVRNTLLQPMLEISKEVVLPDGIDASLVVNDTFTFEIVLTLNNVPLTGTYHAYVHKTGHTVDGALCTPKDHVDDHTPNNDLNLDAWGKGSVTLKSGETYVIVGLPEGAHYTITETIHAGIGYIYKTTVTSDGQNTQSSGDGRSISGTLNTADADGVVEAVHVKYVNEVVLHGLIVTKTVKGNDGETDKEWHFTVTLTPTNGVTLGNTYRYVKTGPGADDKEEGSLTLEEGNKLTFTLKHGQTIVIDDLLEGTTYQVVETEADQDNYKTTVTGANGTISSDGSFVGFVNERNVGSIEIEKTVVNGGNTTDEFEFTITLVPAAGKTLDPTKFTYEPAGTSIQWKTGDTTGSLKGTFKLKKGGKLAIRGIPEGTKFTIEESAAEGYTLQRVLIDGEEKVEGTVAVTEALSVVSVVMENVLSGDLTVSKVVSGEYGETDKEWEFTVELTPPEGMNLAKSYKFTKIGPGADDKEEGSLTLGAGNKLTFTLKHGQSITIHGLPVGTKYGVVEVGAAETGKANANGYTTTVTGDAAGTITSTNIAVAFENKRLSGSVTIQKTVDGEGKEDDKFTFRITLTPAVGQTLDPDRFTYAPAGTAITWEQDTKTGSLTGTFDLKAGESLTIGNIPAGTEFTIEEIKRNGYNLQGIKLNGEAVSGERVTETISGTDAVEQEGALHLSYTVEFINAPALRFPVTGGKLPLGKAFFYLLGGMLLVGAVAGIAIAGKKSKRQSW